MKFQRLTIHNIASIEDATIDFEAQPLADSEVFLITGKTGAGKSTILDSICLALYANTPRFDNTLMEGETKDAEQDISINDTRQLMRRNTVEAHAILTFEGSNGIPYEATWAASRAYKKIHGNIKKTWELKNLNTGETLKKQTEIKSEISAAIGLDFKQFCRTTMLAQGEFTRFLNSKDDDKAVILEKITGADVYTKIGAKVYELTSQKKQDWEDARRNVEGIRTLSDEEIEAKNKLFAELETQQTTLKGQNTTLAAKRDWLKMESTLSRAVSDAKEDLQKAQELVQSDDFKQKASVISDWNATINARQWMTEIHKAGTTKNRLNNQIDGLSSQFADMLGGQQYAIQQATKIADERTANEKYLESEQGKSAIYENAQTIVGWLNTINEGRKAIAKSHTDISLEKNTLEEQLLPVLEKAQQETLAARNNYKEEETKVTRQENELVALNLQALRNQLETAKDLLTAINTAKERIDTVNTVRANRETTRQNLSDQHEALEEKKKQSSGMDEPIREAKIRMDVRKEDLDKQKDTVDKFASTLRLKLQKGDICPVCRQRIEAELPHEDELSALVSGLQQAYTEAEKKYSELVQDKTKLDAEIQSESRTYERDCKAFEEDKSVANAENKAIEAIKVCGMESLDDTTLSALDKLQAATNARKNELTTQIKDGEEKEIAVRELRKNLDGLQKKLNTLTDKEQKADQAVTECRGRITTAETLASSKKNEVETAENQVREAVKDTTWEIDWCESPSAFATALTTAAKSYALAIQKNQELKTKYDKVTTNIQNVATVIEAIYAAIPAWRSIEVTNIAPVSDLLTKANGIDREVMTALTQLKAAEDSLNTNQKQLDSFLQENESMSIARLEALHSYTANDVRQLDDELNKGRNAVVSAKTLVESAENQWKEHQNKKPELTEEDNMDTLQEQIDSIDKQLEEIGETKGSINQELRTDAENKLKLGKLIQEAEDKQVIYQKWSRLNQLIGDAKGVTFRKIAQSYVLSSLIHSANSYMKSLTDRYTLKVNPGTFVISIEDAYQGYVSRAASTISGGESFLVSLALALALSDIGQTLSVDTLFIDEGFGTLSGEPLQNAVNTLRSLHSKTGRHVGIISHVEELQERIPVQIQVQQEGNNSSSTVRIVPE